MPFIKLFTKINNRRLTQINLDVVLRVGVIFWGIFYFFRFGASQN